MQMIELNTIYNENCLDTMKSMPDDFVDLIVTSPPYDNLRSYEGYSFDFENIANSIYRIMKKGGMVIWVVADATINSSETGTSFRQALYFKSIGFNLHDTMIFQKRNYIPLTHNRYEQSFEYMFAFGKGIPKTFNPIRIPCKCKGRLDHRGEKRSRHYDDKQAVRVKNRDEYTKVRDTKLHGNIFEYSIGSSRKGHPAPFPLKLAMDQIISWSNSGDLVYDPFLGSGTTAVACKMLNRNYIGSELSSSYIEIARNWIDHTTPKLFL